MFSQLVATALYAIGLAPLLASAQFPVTGVPGAAENGAVPARRNVNDLYAERGPQWDLYVQALSSFQARNASDPLGYFQISGIHGLPYTEWNHGGAENNDGWGGYCPHGLLVQYAIEIASKYPAAYRSQYMEAANTLRSPYWDWSADSNVPACTVPSRVTINAPRGEGLATIEVNNPLSQYSYPVEALRQQFGEFPQSPGTMFRCPAPDRYPESANLAMQSFSLKEATYDLFFSSISFHEFAVDGRVHHLEELHDKVHLAAACQNSSFSGTDLSGFEPLFMLHHTHVDRLWAYWQFIKPAQASFCYSYPGGSRFSTPQGTMIHFNSPLQPFFRRDLTYHTPKSVRHIQGMGYTYQGLEYWQKSAQQLREDAIQIINRLYAPSTAFAKRDVEKVKTRHFAHIELDRAQVERPCSVKVFIGGETASTMPVMRFPASGKIRSGLAMDKFFDDMASNRTLQSIENLFEVEIRKADGSIIPLSKVDSLKITLEEASITLAKSHMEFPTISDSKKHDAKIKPHPKGEEGH
ncbi:tyrosinase 2 [Metarhizium rileyi]|uniref:tyrosinase n=1 Tax=Metarhizium rileyi (strain RCEF 4871) TaxID=1649241 RepID=A0A167KGF5_METRR|nr:tyrosinase 2 [Metarhizium rileyi RCEF 4871]